MRKPIIDHMVSLANDDDLIVFITNMYNPIVIKKTSLNYSYFDYCIRIDDNAKKEKYMIQLETIEAIKIREPKTLIYEKTVMAGA